MYYILSKEELSHHGVKGMKWGVRKEREVKGRNNKQSKKSKQSIKQFASDHPYVTAGATIAVTLLAIYGSKKVLNLYKEGYFTQQYKSSDIKKLLPTSSNFDMKVTNDIPGCSKNLLDQITKGPVKLQSLSEKDQKALNKAMKNGYFTNCVHCTNAASLRRKGYDVVATNSMTGHKTKDVLKWWKGAKITKVFNLPGALSAKSTDDKLNILEKSINNQGVGSYGDLHIKGGFSAHSVQYNVTTNGIVINDYQVRRTYSSLKELFDNSPGFDPIESSFIRLDNCKPDINQMLKDHIIKPRG